VEVISGSATISQVFPADVVTISIEPNGLSYGLYPQEAAHVAMAVQKRRQEYAAGRACAREALRQLGYGEPAVLSRNDGAPIWPPGVVGSITHCPGYCGAAVARRGRIVGLGVDAEPIGELPPDLRPLVCSEWERNWIDTHQGAYATDLYKLMFSAKESVFKAIHPLVRCMVAFDDVTIRVGPDAAIFGAAIFHIDLAPWLADQFRGWIIGRFLVTSSHVFTGVTLGDTATW
jgi:4'-phosphopantetheinyl transferase EntD